MKVRKKGQDFFSRGGNTRCPFLIIQNAFRLELKYLIYRLKKYIHKQKVGYFAGLLTVHKKGIRLKELILLQKPSTHL